MARKSNRRRNRRRNRRGGNSAASASSYSDGSSYMMSTVGDGKTQYDNVFMSDKNSSPSNTVVGLQGQRAGSRKGLKGGSHKRLTKKRKGGYWGQVINQAIVPFTLLGLQQRYGRKSRGSTKKRRF
jgi:hypothetical protein